MDDGTKEMEGGARRPAAPERRGGARMDGSRTGRGGERGRNRGKRTGPIVRRVAVGAALALLLVGGVLAGNAVREAGCGDGRRAVIAQLAPLGTARATFEDNKLKDICVAEYATTAAPAEVFAHHGAQLTHQGWTVAAGDPLSDPPSLQARRGNLAVYISVVNVSGETTAPPDQAPPSQKPGRPVVDIDGEKIVQLAASRLE